MAIIQGPKSDPLLGGVSQIFNLCGQRNSDNAEWRHGSLANDEPAGRIPARRTDCKSVLQQGDDAVEVSREGEGVGVEDLEGGAGAGDVVEEDFPLAAGEDGAAFEAVVAAGFGGEPRLCETRMAQWRQLKLRTGFGARQGGDAQVARLDSRQLTGVGDVAAGDGTQLVGQQRCHRDRLTRERHELRLIPGSTVVDVDHRTDVASF